MNEITKGCVAITDKGLLFIAVQVFRLPGHGPGKPNSWHGIAFNGEPIHTEHCSFISPNLNQYLHETYGTNYSKELAEAAAPTS